MPDNSIALIAHLMRRAGFGASRSELEEQAAREYSDVVEGLLDPEAQPDLEEDVLRRYHLDLTYPDGLPIWAGRWVWRMINSSRPLEEKMALFWHHVFATAWYKGEHTPSMISQIDTFRRDGMSDLRTIFMGLAKDPAMNYWLDNCENHADQPNENWGRELLELFSMGVGNYSEFDIKEASRAFTGWTFTQPIPLYPFGHHSSRFEFVAEDHDDTEKTFLSHTGPFNGEDIIDIVADQPATARFIARHLYSFFVADEPQVPAWSIEPPRDPETVDALVNAFEENDGQIVPVLRTLFNSDAFKNARQKRVKSPVELVVGVIKLVGTYKEPDPTEPLPALVGATAVMGQQIMNPPTVEGWHTGHEWIDGGTLNERVNFAVNQFSDSTKPGIQELLSRVEGTLTPSDLVDRCLELLGPLEVGDQTRSALQSYADYIGEINLDSEQAREDHTDDIVRLLQCIVASREYQFA